MSKDKNSNEIDLSKYKDSTGLTVGKLNFGLWLSESRTKITKIVVICLIGLSAFLFLYSSYNYVIYFLDTANSKKTDAVDTVSVVTPKNIVDELDVSRPNLFKVGENYDLVVLVKNPNDKFSANFNYCFIIDQEDTRCANGSIMPKEEKYLSLLGQKVADSISGITVKIDNTTWQRFDAHEIPDWNRFLNERSNFNLENIKLSMGAVQLPVKSSFDSLSFSITNRTAYSYYEVPLNVTFYRGDELVGINRYVVKDFLSGDKKQVRIKWAGGLSGVTRTEIRPDLNLLNNSIYLKYQGIK